METPLLQKDEEHHPDINECKQILSDFFKEMGEVFHHTEKEISNKSIKYFLKHNIPLEEVLMKVDTHHVRQDFVFHYIFGLAFKQFLIDVMAELYGTPVTSIDQNKLSNIDPSSEEFMDDVKELLAMTSNLEVDEDKPLTYRLLKQIEANMALNKKRSALQSFYQLKMLSKKTQRLIVLDFDNNFVLSHELNENGGIHFRDEDGREYHYTNGNKVYCSQDENKPESPDKPLS